MIFYINENGAKKCKSSATKEGWRFPLRQHMQKQTKKKARDCMKSQEHILYKGVPPG